MRGVRVLLMLSAVLVAGTFAAPAAAQLPPGLVDQVVLDDIADPTSLAFLAGGGMLISLQAGEVIYWDESPAAPESVIDLDAGNAVCNGGGEQGLLGIAVNAASNRAFVYYTANLPGGCSNQLVRYDLDTNVSPPAMTNPEVLITGLPSDPGNHNGGDVQIGNDGFIYVSIGEAAHPARAQQKFNLQGKIIRVTEEGDIPPGGNAFKGSTSASCADGPIAKKKRCREIFAYGLRNPYRIAFDSNVPGTKFFINDVGAGTWEEINRGKLGANYGWPKREGPCAQGESSGKSCKDKPKRFDHPLHAYKHTTGCRTITGGAFVPNGSAWPNQIEGDYLFADYICGKIFWLDHIGTKNMQRKLLNDVPDFGPVHMAFSPDGHTLYYLTHADGGQLRLIGATP